VPILYDMSDLSRLLEDVYAGETAPSPPAWSSDEALDDAFASWVPGPPAEASAAERAFAAVAVTEVAVPHAESLAEVQTPTPSGFQDALDEPEQLAEVVPIVGRWTPSDDDILPARGIGKTKAAKQRGFRLR